MFGVEGLNFERTIWTKQNKKKHSEVHGISKTVLKRPSQLKNDMAGVKGVSYAVYSYSGGKHR